VVVISLEFVDLGSVTVSSFNLGLLESEFFFLLLILELLVGSGILHHLL
jgi:hypothetical protein